MANTFPTKKRTPGGDIRFGRVRPVQVGEDQIRVRAQQIFDDRVRKNQPGDALGDWLQAERELRSPRRGPGRR